MRCKPGTRWPPDAQTPARPTDGSGRLAGQAPLRRQGFCRQREQLLCRSVLLVGITTSDAAEILGVSKNAVYKLVSRGTLVKDSPYARAQLDRCAVEDIALERVRRGVRNPYWATCEEAAELLGVTQRRVRQLATKERIPGRLHRGRWYFRRRQLEVVAHARDSRRCL